MRGLLQLRGADPGRFALKAALRAALVMPSVFAFADLVIGNRQTSLIAAFGCVAMLVLVDFGGPPRARLAAYAWLGAIGALLIVLGTLCSNDPWLAAGSTLVVTFAILFSGVVNGWFAAGSYAAIVAFVLPVALAADPDVIPDRLLGWVLAAVASTAAQLLLWPSRPRDRVRTATEDACRALAALVETGEDSGGRLADADAALAELDRRTLASPYRPSGSTSGMAALAFLVDELAWFRTAAAGGGEDGRADQAEGRETARAVAAALRESAATLSGARDAPDLARLDAAREAQRQRLAVAVAQLCSRAEVERLPPDVREAFRLYAAARSASRIAARASLAAGHAAPHRAAALIATERLAVEHASARSVWFRNSVRGAVALAVAVVVAQQSGVQQAFWVVLGTLSVLRSSALGIGSTIAEALAGTAVGIVVGGVVVSVIPTGSAVLWAVLPFALLLAAYAPRVVSFAAGQAGFTLVLVILFNIQQPTGWQVGLVRVEDVAIGFAISLAMGLLFWPRGAASLLRENLQSAYGRAGDLLGAARRLLADDEDAAPEVTLVDVREVERAERAAMTAADRLDDVFRQYLAERPAGRMTVPDVGVLVSGATRVRRTARALLDGRAAAAPLPPPDRSRFARVWARLYLEELARLQQRVTEPAAAIGLRLPPVDVALPDGARVTRA